VYQVRVAQVGHKATTGRKAILARLVFLAPQGLRDQKVGKD
jgi:hypothetical protein